MPSCFFHSALSIESTLVLTGTWGAFSPWGLRVLDRERISNKSSRPCCLAYSQADSFPVPACGCAPASTSKRTTSVCPPCTARISAIPRPLDLLPEAPAPTSNSSFTTSA